MSHRSHRTRIRALGFAAVSAAVAVIPAVSSAVVVPGNLVLNPSFETGSANWVGYQAGISRVALAGAPDGASVAKASRTTGTSFTLDDAPATVASAVTGVTYTARAYVRAATGSSVGKPLRINLREGTTTGFVRTVQSRATALTNGWQLVSVTMSGQVSGRRIDLYIGQSAATAGDAFYADQISLVGGTSAPPPPPPPPPPQPLPNVVPSASFGQSPTAPAVGQAVTFTDTSTDSDGSIAARAWDLDNDGLFDDASGASAGRVFAASGSYTVRLQVTDDRGGLATAVRTFVVDAVAPTPPPPASANLFANPSFETLTAGWSSYQGSIVREALAGAPEGAYVARVSRTGGTSFSIGDYPGAITSARSDATYTATAHVRAASASSVGKRVGIALREANGSSFVRTSNGTSIVLSNAFQRVSVAMSGAAAGNRIDMYVHQTAAAAGDAFYIDDIAMSDGATTPPPPPPGALPRLTTFATGVVVPWAIATAPDGSHLFTERPGRVRVISKDGVLSPTALLTVPVSLGSESGMLGIALHPSFPAVPQVYLYATIANPDLTLTGQVKRYTLDGATGTLIDPVMILDGIPASTRHDGGGLAFGPDGKLYITTGDATVPGNAADLNSLAGKILRLEPDGSIPADNPFASAVWSYGHRNPQGIAWTTSGAMYSSEHGPTGDGELALQGHDELNRIVKGGFYGWPYRSGTVAATTAPSPIPFTDPVLESGSDVWAPASLAFMPGTEPSLFAANLKGENLRRFVLDAANPDRVVRTEVPLNGYGRLRATHVLPNGCLLLSTSNRDGRGVVRLDDDRIVRFCGG